MMFGRRLKIRRFDYTPFYHDPGKEENSDKRRIIFKRMQKASSGTGSLVKLITIFAAAIIAYLYLRTFI